MGPWLLGSEEMEQAVAPGSTVLAKTPPLPTLAKLLFSREGLAPVQEEAELTRVLSVFFDT